MIFEECKLFRDVAHARSLSRAAAMNGISQSAATQHIQELEKRLGVQLLDRSTRPLGLTPGGKLYADLCRDVLRREEDFVAALDEIKAEAEGTVRVASIYSIGLSEMSRLREEFARACPGAQLHVEYLRPDKVYQAVLEDQADLGFISYPENRRDLTVIPWREERMTVAVYPSHPFAGREMSAAEGSRRPGLHLVRRRSDHSPRAGPVLPGARSQHFDRDAVRQYSVDQRSGGARFGHQHSAGADDADRGRAEPAGFDSAACARNWFGPPASFTAGRRN